MEVENQVRLKFLGVDFINISFNSLKYYGKESNDPIAIKIDPKVFYPQDKSNHFKIIMDVSIKANDYFNFNLHAIGNFELDKDIDSKLKETFVNTNAPAIMFPYVRSFVSNLTASIGKPITTITIPPQFFTGQINEVDK